MQVTREEFAARLRPRPSQLTCNMLDNTFVGSVAAASNFLSRRPPSETHAISSATTICDATSANDIPDQRNCISAVCALVWSDSSFRPNRVVAIGSAPWRRVPLRVNLRSQGMVRCAGQITRPGADNCDPRLLGPRESKFDISMAPVCNDSGTH